MLTLQLACSQFGPRMLRNFMRDRGNQIVLGTFLSTFVYSLLVLASVRGSGDSYFVPVIAVSFGMILAVASLATLIYFIHHIATSIRIETHSCQASGRGSRNRSRRLCRPTLSQTAAPWSRRAAPTFSRRNWPVRRLRPLPGTGSETPTWSDDCLMSWRDAAAARPHRIVRRSCNSMIRSG